VTKSCATGSLSLRARAVRRLGAMLALLLAASCLPSRQDVDTAQALIEIGDALNDIRNTQSELQDQIDSLRWAITRRDSVIRQLANLAGVAVPP
jgi:hypothetical protein